MATATAVELLRLVEVNTRSLAQNTLTVEQYSVAIDKLGPQISNLGQSLVTLNPPDTAKASHEHLLSTADSLLETTISARSFMTNGNRLEIVNAINSTKQARGKLLDLIDSIGTGGASDTLTSKMAALGEFQITTSKVWRFVVLVGEFESAAVARAKLKSFKADTTLSPEFPSWVEVGRYDHVAEAETAAQLWNDRNFPLRIDTVPDIAFSYSVTRKPKSGGWKELIWLQMLKFDPISISGAADGTLFALVSKDGHVKTIRGNGESSWSSQINMPTSSITVSPNGQTLAMMGFDLFSYRNDGSPHWRKPFRPDNQLLEQGLITENGLTVLRSSNASQLGRVFAYSPSGLRWTIQRDDIGATSIDVDQNKALTAIASYRSGISQVLIVNEEGTFLQQFGVEKEIQQILLLKDGSRTAVLTADSVEIYDSERGEFLRELSVKAHAIAGSTSKGEIFLASSRGVSAYSLAGDRLWFNDSVRMRDLQVSDTYICGSSSDTSVSVVRTNGDYLGDATTLSSLRGYTLSRKSNILVAVSAERNVLAWQLPSY